MNIKKKSVMLALSLAFSTLSANTVAAEDITGNVSEVFVRNDGVVIADISGDSLGNLYLCSVSTTLRSVTTAACAEMLDVLVAAKLSGIPVVISGTKVPTSEGATSYNVTVSYLKLAN